MPIEAIIINYLIDQNLPGIGSEVYAETPVDPPDNFVLIRRAGGGSANYVRSFNVITETVSKVDKITAAANHETIVEAMLRMWGNTSVYSCRLNSDYDATLPAMKDYRYQALWQITI